MAGTSDGIIPGHARARREGAGDTAARRTADCGLRRAAAARVCGVSCPRTVSPWLAGRVYFVPWTCTYCSLLIIAWNEGKQKSSWQWVVTGDWREAARPIGSRCVSGSRGPHVRPSAPWMLSVMIVFVCTVPKDICKVIFNIFWTNYDYYFNDTNYTL